MATHSSETLWTSCWRRSVSRPHYPGSSLRFLQVSKPFFATLHKWLFSGELYDPFSEFFVAIDPKLAHVQHSNPGQPPVDDGFTGLGADTDDFLGEPEGGLRLWEAKYHFQKDMLPMFVGESFGRKACLERDFRTSPLTHPQISSTGKSLNFIRYICQDSDWVITREKMSNTGGSEWWLPLCLLLAEISVIVSLKVQ